MAILESNQHKHDFVVSEVSNSDLSAALKEDIVEVLGNTLASTNGMTQDQKIQASTQNQFDMMRLFALQLVSQGRHVTTWKDVIVKCRVPLFISATILGTSAIVALILQPQLAAMVEHLAGK